MTFAPVKSVFKNVLIVLVLVASQFLGYASVMSTWQHDQFTTNKIHFTQKKGSQPASYIIDEDFTSDLEEDFEQITSNVYTIIPHFLPAEGAVLLLSEGRLFDSRFILDEAHPILIKQGRLLI